MNRITSFFRRHRVIGGLLFALLVFIALFIIVNVANAPESSPVQVTRCVTSDDGACIRFPTVNGTNLFGAAFTLPADFTGDLNLIIMPFDEDQQVRAASWLPLARELAAENPQFAYYDLPTLPAVNPLVRAAITGGMSLVIPEDLRAISVMLFLEELDVFLAALAIPDRDATQVLLLNADGEVVWRTRGDFTDEGDISLRAAVTASSAP